MKRTTLAAVILTGLLTSAYAEVSPEEARQLGTNLTRFGAIKAGNKEGTIPEYTGEAVKIPADYKPGSGIYTDPYQRGKAAVPHRRQKR
ncbi:hypothetical protein LP415_14190 [Polaromonas sp. P1(28)-8]|nr:hypothetical protein LP415_14190 [Polaromonas sp. P1(28)-8]